MVVVLDSPVDVEIINNVNIVDQFDDRHKKETTSILDDVHRGCIRHVNHHTVVGLLQIDHAR